MNPTFETPPKTAVGSPLDLRKSNCSEQSHYRFHRRRWRGPDIWLRPPCVHRGGSQGIRAGSTNILVEIPAGEKSFQKFGEYLPEHTFESIQEALIVIKGPLTTPVGGGFRSLNVTLRQKLDLYACVRPVRYIPGAPSPVLRPQDVDMVIFRENTEDVYAGIE